jgi:hypothetical protein
MRRVSIDSSHDLGHNHVAPDILGWAVSTFSSDLILENLALPCRKS